MIQNSTNIPDRLVAIALAFVMNDEDMLGIEPPSFLTIKNKKVGKVHGQWGWYYSHERRIVLIVPRTIRKSFRVHRRYARGSYICTGRSDFLVGVLAHEMRHCYQFQKWDTPGSKWRLEWNKLGKLARETDAELYEIRMIRKWQESMTALQLVGR